MNAVPRLISLATAVPPHVLDQREVALGAGKLFAGSYSDWSRLAPVYANAEIDTRHSCVPIDWYMSPHGFAERNQLFLDNAVTLLQTAAERALDDAGLRSDQIDGLVIVSSSGVATPSLDARLMERMGFRRDLMRLPIFGLGCAGGVLGLGRTAQLAMAMPSQHYLFCVVELCGLTFRHADRSKSNIVATALFGDGAAAAVIGAGDRGRAIGGWAEHTWPASLGVMGWDVRDDGLAVVFSRDIPTWVRRNLGEQANAFLASRGLAMGDIETFVAHPGGAKVLDALEEVFELPHGGLADSRATLRMFGNMSAATVLFVLRRVLDRQPQGRSLLSSLGPGFTAGFLLLDPE